MCHAAAWIKSGVRDGHGPFWKGWSQKAMKAFPDLPVIGNHIVTRSVLSKKRDKNRCLYFSSFFIFLSKRYVFENGNCHSFPKTYNTLL